jgi:hypothetical protein
MIDLVHTLALVALAYGLYAVLRRLDTLETRIDLIERRERLNR